MTRENDNKPNQVSTSFVSDVINFDALKNPPWRLSVPRRDKNWPTSVEEMMKEILEFQHCFESQKSKISEDNLEMVKNELLVEFIFGLNREEDHGLGTIEETKQSLEKLHNKKLSEDIESIVVSVREKETLNICKAYKRLEKLVDEECKEDASLHGFLESSIIKELHKIILSDLPLPKGMTRPGECSNSERLTTFQGKIYHYKKPDDMEEALNTLLDRFNSLLNWLNTEEDELSRIYKLFKASSWLLFELLDLHPFADGNGRLVRLLCSYVLSLLNPFPTPVYNILCENSISKIDYYNALVNARMSSSRHPEELTTMIIECNWNSWREFVDRLKLPRFLMCPNVNNTLAS